LSSYAVGFGQESKKARLEGPSARSAKVGQALTYLGNAFFRVPPLGQCPPAIRYCHGLAQRKPLFTGQCDQCLGLLLRSLNLSTKAMQYGHME
jgi:hypothetical protein